MIINDIEYAVRFWIDDEDGETILDEVFSSLEEMNEFIEKMWRKPEYADVTVYFSPVEVINGKPDDSVRWHFELSPFMPLEEAEIKDYYYEFKDSLRVSKEMAERLGQDTKFEPREDSIDYERKKKHRADITYICPYCFREVDDCRCSSYSYHLVQIDKLMVPIIRTLNKKGYITTACCSGHLEENHSLSIYIAFKNEHDFGNNLPVGAVYSKAEQVVRYTGLENMAGEVRARFQNDCIESITAWADSLPSLR